MAGRMPLAYPSLEAGQINFSLPLRLARRRSTSTPSTHSSTKDPLEVDQPMRPRAISAPVSPAHASGPSSTRLSGSTCIPSPSFPNWAGSFNLRPRPVSHTPTYRQVPSRLQLHNSIRNRASSTSTTASSLKESLAELEELIEVLSTPLDEEFCSAQTQIKTEAGAGSECSKTVHFMLAGAKQPDTDERSPVWI